MTTLVLQRDTGSADGESGHSWWVSIKFEEIIVASYGAKDVMLSRAATKLETLLAEGAVARDVKEYPDVGHSFMNDFPTPSVFQFVERIAGLAYSEPEAEDAWRRILVFFGEHLR